MATRTVADPADPAEPSSQPGSPGHPISARVLAAMEAVPRRVFLPPESSGRDAQGLHLPIGEGQSLPPGPELARMIDALELTDDARVLHVGTGSGYVAAVLGQLSREVFTIERLGRLVGEARRRLAEVKAINVQVVHGDGQKGMPKSAPFDAILIGAAVSAPPPELLAQLGTGGRLVAAVGAHRSAQRLHRVRRTGDHDFDDRDLGPIRMARAIGDVLVEMGAITRDAAERAALDAATAGVPMGERLVEDDVASEVDIYRALAAQRGMRFGDVRQLMGRLDNALVARLPLAFLKHNRLMPIAFVDRVLEVATPDPDASVGELTQATGAEAVRVFLVTPTDYRRLWTAFGLQGARAASVETVEPSVTVEPTDDEADQLDARYVTLFESILLDAHQDRASDIHLERYGETVRVRLRVDGELRDLEGTRPSPRELRGVVNVLKVRSGLDIAEHRVPQGGRQTVRVGGQLYDLRVQTQPTLYGEYAVIRLLAQNKQLLSIEDLGFPKPIADQYRRLLQSPAGLVLSVGPTGSGKTTTLYAGLQILAADATRKVITAEDPIEYSIDGVEQTQVRPEVGFHFADAMRAFVRQDPDVILVGEIRDPETALEAIRASQTGHVVLSTLHCNDAIDAVQRLFDLGMHHNSIASELLAVMAQRLAKRLCATCTVPAVPEPEILAELFPGGAPAGFRAFRGEGCRMCNGHGTRGRVAVVEFLRAVADVRGGIARRLPVDELRRLGLASGLHPMRDQALALVQAGTIPLAELPLLLPAERMAPERH
jgi:type IV pilus assembly protein PilB